MHKIPYSNLNRKRKTGQKCSDQVIVISIDVPPLPQFFIVHVDHSKMVRGNGNRLEVSRRDQDRSLVNLQLCLG